MRYRTFATIAIFLTGIGATASAQQPSLGLQFQNGTVSLRAQNVAVRQILAEWARVGGTRIVDGDRVSGGPVSLELTNVPEQQALDIVLRGVAGYMLAPRASASTGASVFDRILILPSSNAPRAATPPPAFGTTGVRPGILMPSVPARAGLAVEGNPGGAAPADDDDEEDEDDEDADDAPAGVGANPMPRSPTTPPVLPPRAVPTPGMAPLGGIPAMIRLPPEQDADEPGQRKAAPTPRNPFGGPAGSSLPGVITPVPPQQPNPR